jgi:hypothetical protein
LAPDWRVLRHNVDGRIAARQNVDFQTVTIKSLINSTLTQPQPMYYLGITKHLRWALVRGSKSRNCQFFDTLEVDISEKRRCKRRSTDWWKPSIIKIYCT